MKSKRCAWAANPKKAVAYLRVSTRGQQELGVSAQRAALESWAKRDGFEICEWFEEEVSGGASLERRPILLRAIAALGDHGAGLLVVQRVDRFSRDPLTAAMAELQVQRLGARVASADGMGNGDDPGSRLMRDVGLAAARFERAMIAARTKAALGVKKSRGECTGTPPFGFRVGDDGKTLVPDEGERETARRLRALRESGWPYRQIRTEAKRLGMTSRAGKPFTLRAVFGMTKDAECRQVADNSDSTDALRSHSEAEFSGYPRTGSLEARPRFQAASCRDLKRSLQRSQTRNTSRAHGPGPSPHAQESERVG